MDQYLEQLLVSPERAIPLLIKGAVGVLPTDTVYGLTARAHDKQAVARLYALKHREHKPGTIVAASTQQLLDLGVSPTHLSKIRHLWPASISIETPLGGSLRYLHQDTGRQGLRVVADARLRTILEQTGPLLTSSANQPGAPGATDVTQAWKYFGTTIDFYVDGGDLSGRSPSTIIRITDTGAIEIIRQGAVKLP